MSPGEGAAGNHGGLAGRLLAARRLLEAGDAAGALREVGPGARGGDVVASALAAVARARQAEDAGDTAAADRALAEMPAQAPPVAPVLHALGRLHMRHARYREAHAAYVLLACTQPEAIFEFWNALPPPQKCRYAPAAVATLLHASPPRIYPLQPLKQAAVEAWGEAGAAVVLQPMLRPGKSVRVVDLPLVGLQDYARKHALHERELIAPRDVFLWPPIVHGRPPLPALAGRSRRVFLCVLPDIVVTGKSNRLLARDAVLLDFQGGEPERTVINHDADPLVLAAAPGRCTVLDVLEGHRQAPLDAGFSLVGIHTWNYGHWVFEFLFQVWACRDEPGFAGVPLIVDEQMPPQLREALAFFVGADHPVVVLRPGGSVRVARLWTCSKIAYWPGGDRPGLVPSAEAEISDTAALATLVRGLESELAAVVPAPAQPRRIYLRRKPNQKRGIANHRDVEQWFAAQGFELLDFGELSFIEQLRWLRGADIVVGPDSAAFYGLLFARPGTRLGTLSQHHLDGYEWWSQMFRELGLHMLVLPGELHRLNPAYRAQSDTLVDLDRLPGFLAALETLEDTRTRGDAAEIAGGVRRVPGDDDVPAVATHFPTPRPLQEEATGLVRAAQLLATGLLADSVPIDEVLDLRPVGRALHLAASADLARERGDADEAAQRLAQAAALGVPLAPLLRVLGRDALARGDFAAAFEHYALLDRLAPGAIWEFEAGIDDGRRAQHAPAPLRASLRRQRPLFYHLQLVKEALVHALGEAGAAMVIAESIGGDATWRLRRLPLAGLLEYAHAHAVEFVELIAPREVHMGGPEVFGRPTMPGFTGRTRSVFFCVLADAMVWGKCNMLRAGDRALLDHQGTEYARIPLNLDVNPPVVVADDDQVSILEHDSPVRQPDLSEAFSLVGLHTYNYGHWIFEHLFQVWACMDRPGFAQVPLLVDAQMPAQHRELLEFFVGPDHPVVVLDPGQSVAVRRLWTCSKISYWPGGEKLPAPPVHDYELSDTPALAALIGRLQPRLDALDLTGRPERIYLTRHAAQGRPLADRGDVEAFFAARGFAVLDFTRVPMLEQLQYLRAARTVVLEAGSSMYGGLFCRPGTRIGELCDDDTSEHEWCAGMFRALGLRMLLFPCVEVGPPTGLKGSVEKRADLDRLDAYLEALESDPSPAGEST